MNIKQIELVQAGHEWVNKYLDTIGFDPSIRKFKILYGEENDKKEIMVENGIADIGLVKFLMGLDKILPNIQSPEDLDALSALLKLRYNEILLGLQLRDDDVILAALLIKKASLLRTELENVKSGQEIKIEVIR
jgi:hypothetical protein